MIDLTLSTMSSVSDESNIVAQYPAAIHNALPLWKSEVDQLFTDMIVTEAKSAFKTAHELASIDASQTDHLVFLAVEVLK